MEAGAGGAAGRGYRVVEMRHLRYFVAVAEELHFGRAAARLHVSQSPLSQQIIQLERELGVELLERTKRRVELTAAGEVYLEEARRVLALNARAEEAASRAARGEAGRLVLGSRARPPTASCLRCFRPRGSGYRTSGSSCGARC